MTWKIPTLAVLLALAIGCSRSGRMQHGQEQYQVVQEGSASGVTSTINGPGETRAPATDTNVDTTTNFTLSTNPGLPSKDTSGSTVAGSLTSNPIYPARTSGLPTSGTAPNTRPTRPTHNRAMDSAVPPVVIDTVGSPTSSMLKETRSATADTASSSTSGTDAKTATTTDRQQPPPPTTDTTGTQRSFL